MNQRMAPPVTTDRPIRARPGHPLPLRLYRGLTRAAAPVSGLILRYRARHGKEDPARRGERIGHASLARPDGPLAWVHAASVGETNAILPLIVRLRAERPDLMILLTTGTVTSARFVAARRPDGVIHQFMPLDSPAFMGRFLDYWRPSLAVLTEQEIWPNLVLEAKARAVPLALVNARMSDRSFGRWRRRPDLAAALLSCLTVVVAQNEELAERFRMLGAETTIAAGNLKIDAPPLPVDREAHAKLEAALQGRPRMVAASTHAGEELLIGEAHREIRRHADGFCTIIAPRHPERGPGLADAMTARGFNVACRSLGALPGPATDIYIADTIGELGTLYASSPVAFIGGSLIPHGGQNPIEAVRHGAVVLTGPSWTNFADVYAALFSASGAIEVRTSDDIARAVLGLLQEPAQLTAHLRSAEHALTALSGALDRTIAALLPLIADEWRAARAV